MVYRLHRHSSLCPVCGRTEETLLHMLTCPQAEPLRTNLLLQFKLWLLSVQTDPTLIHFFLSGLSLWFHDPSCADTFYSSDNIILQAYTSQLCIGWFSTLCGYLSKDIIKDQALYYTL